MVAVFTYVYYTYQPKDLHPRRIMKIDLHSFFIRINQRNYITNNLEKKSKQQKKSRNPRKLAVVDLNGSIVHWSRGQERDSTSARVLRTQPAGLPISSGNGDGWNWKWYRLYRHQEDCSVIRSRFYRGVGASFHSQSYLDAPLGKIILQKTPQPG